MIETAWNNLSILQNIWSKIIYYSWSIYKQLKYKNMDWSCTLKININNHPLREDKGIKLGKEKKWELLFVILFYLYKQYIWNKNN